MPKISAFADEVADDFLEQVKYLAREHVNYIEPRFFNRKNILDLNQNDLKQAKKMLYDYGIKVSAIGSPIGKIKIDEPFEPHLDRFKHSVDIAQFFETSYIRVFSYYPPDGGDINEYRTQVMERFQAMVNIINNTDLVMVHENEARIYGHSAENCVDLVQTINSDKLRLVYDPANFVQGEEITDNIQSCWPKMKPYVVHIHIKDWKLGETTGSIPGRGDGQIIELLTELKMLKYEGYLTMEPHLQTGGQFSGSTGHELFSQALDALKNLAQTVNLNIE